MKLKTLLFFFLTIPCHVFYATIGLISFRRVGRTYQSGQAPGRVPARHCSRPSAIGFASPARTGPGRAGECRAGLTSNPGEIGFARLPFKARAGRHFTGQAINK